MSKVIQVGELMFRTKCTCGVHPRRGHKAEPINPPERTKKDKTVCPCGCGETRGKGKTR